MKIGEIMNLLLINKNPVVSRMIHLSAPKVGLEIKECSNVYDLPKGHFDIVVIDDEMFDENFLKDIKNSIDFEKIGIITSSKEEQADGFDFVLIKPFLPTDLVELLRSLKSKIENAKTKKNETEENIEIENSQEDNIKNILLLNNNSDKEEIVAISEEEEDEPFISQDELQEGGVLDKQELTKVQELLEDEEENQQTEENFEIKEEKIELPENEKEKSKEIEAKEEPKESVKNEEEKKPLIFEKVEESKKLNSNKKKEKRKKGEYSSEDKLKALINTLDLYSIRELLDGMEVTIKINFNKKNKKKKKWKKKENF